MSEAARCSACGTELSETSAQGLCPACLLKLGLSDSHISASPEDPSVQAQPAVKAELPIHRHGVHWAVPATAVVALLLVVAGLAIFLQRPLPPPVRILRFDLVPPKDAIDFAVSPDGLHLVFSASDEQGITSLWMHSFDAFGERRLPGTESGASPFWSPDSHSVGFFAARKLKTIDIANVAPQVLCDAPAGQGGTWNVTGTIVFAANLPGSLYRVSSKGGIPQPVSSVDSSDSQTIRRRPHFFPDGRHFLYAAVSANPKNGGIYVGSLDSMEIRRLAAGAEPAYADNAVLFVQDDVLLAQPFDPARLEFAGEARRIRLADHVQRFSVSGNGVLAYQNGEHPNTPIAFIDRLGKQLQTIDDAQGATQFSLSPDGKILATSRLGDIWLSDLSRGVTSRFTFDPAAERFPVWAPDESRILFLSNRNGANGIYQKARSGEPEELVFNTRDAYVESIDDWSADGRIILYTALDQHGKPSLWAMPLPNDRKPFLIQSSFSTRQGRFSPDGRWLAYVSDESGKDEVYVEGFPGRENKLQVSNSGGTNPRWRRDGRELFYIAPARQLMSVSVTPASQTLQLGIPRVLVAGVARDSYDVTSDGQRFVVLSNLDNEPLMPIHIVVNWASERY